MYFWSPDSQNVCHLLYWTQTRIYEENNFMLPQKAHYFKTVLVLTPPERVEIPLAARVFRLGSTEPQNAVGTLQRPEGRRLQASPHLVCCTHRASEGGSGSEEGSTASPFESPPSPGGLAFLPAFVSACSHSPNAGESPRSHLTCCLRPPPLFFPTLLPSLQLPHHLQDSGRC